MIKVTSMIKMNMAKIRELTTAQITALEQTAEALHTEVVQAQVVPFEQGTLQGESFFVDDSDAKKGTVTLVNSTPYARHLYFHPEYRFQTKENPNARGEWYEDWLAGGKEADFCKKAFKALYKKEGAL